MTTSILTAIQTADNRQVPKWQPATWQDYLAYRDSTTANRLRLFFNGNYLFVDMGSEGINHASISDFFTMLFFVWFSRFPQQTASSLGQQCVYSVALKGLPIPLLEQTLERLSKGMNMSAAGWFAQTIANLNIEEIL
jgi:hypothetical protein